MPTQARKFARGDPIRRGRLGDGAIFEGKQLNRRRLRVSNSIQTAAKEIARREDISTIYACKKSHGFKCAASSGQSLGRRALRYSLRIEQRLGAAFSSDSAAPCHA